MSAVLLAILLAVASRGLTLASPPSAAGKTSAATTPHYVVITHDVRTRTAAVSAAKKLSAKLRLPIVEKTLRKPPEQRLVLGHAVSVHGPRVGRFLVSTFLGEGRDAAAAALARARKASAAARIVPVAVRDLERLDAEYQAYQPMLVLILASIKACQAAMKGGRALALKAGLRFDTRDLICDHRRGLIWPDDVEDDVYAGTYWGRRYGSVGEKGQPPVSVERADFYGFRRGYYIVVGGLFGTAETHRARRALARLRKTVPGAYLKQTTLYMGCIH